MLTVVLLVTLGQSSPDVGLAEIQQRLKSRGPKATMQFLFQDDERWDSFLGDVGGGETAWLDIAATLHPVSDGHASETLSMAIQEALPANPRGVLGLVLSGEFEVDEACGNYGFGQIEDERPKEIILGLVDKRIEAVSRLEEEFIRGVQQECLVLLRALREQLAQ